MNENLRISGWLVIFVTLLIGLLLMLLPLPTWAVAFRPAWLWLVVCYWAIALPHRVNLTIAWLSGLILDSLQGTLLGENAVVFVICIYIAITLHRRIRVFSLIGQAFTIFLLCLLNQLLLFWIEGLQGQMITAKSLIGIPLLSACFWPWLFIVLTNCLRRYRLH